MRRALSSRSNSRAARNPPNPHPSMTIRLMYLLNLLNEPTRPLPRLCAVRRAKVKQQSQSKRFRGAFRAQLSVLCRWMLGSFLLLALPACEAPDPDVLDPLTARLEQIGRASCRERVAMAV